VYHGKRTLALIPARGGSKGLPRKNVLEVGGKPLIAWTIEAGLASGYVDAVVVTTDDPEIAEVARAYGAEVPFLRPAELANDSASSIDVVIHAADALQAAGERYDALVLLEPTSPLREASDIDACIELLYSREDAEAVVTVAPLECTHPDFVAIIDTNGFIRSRGGGAEFRHTRRQDLEPLYYFEGTVYASRIDAIRTRRGFYHEKTLAHVVPRWKALEIDDVYDLVCAGALLDFVSKERTQ